MNMIFAYWFFVVFTVYLFAFIWSWSLFCRLTVCLVYLVGGAAIIVIFFAKDGMEYSWPIVSVVYGMPMIVVGEAIMKVKSNRKGANV